MLQKRSVFTIILLLNACLFLGACAYSPKRAMQSAELQREAQLLKMAERVFHDELFSQQVSTDESVFALSEAQKAEFDAYFYAPERQNIEKHIRFGDFLDEKMHSFHYYGATLVASEAFDTESGNCLALAILTTALADHAQLDIAYQQVNSEPVYAKHGNIILLSTHVRARIFKPHDKAELEDESAIIIRRASVVIDYFPNKYDLRGKHVSRDSFISMYYQNRAAESLVAGHLDLAYQYAKKGIKSDPSNAESYNILAVVYKRAGHTHKALNVHEALLSNKLISVNAIENYAQLLKSEGDYQKADSLLPYIENANERNPYQWLSIASAKYEEGEYTLALKYAKKAQQLAPYIHQPYFLIAKVYYSLEQFNKSHEALKLAKAHARDDDAARLYSAKLHVFGRAL